MIWLFDFVLRRLEQFFAASAGSAKRVVVPAALVAAVSAAAIPTVQVWEGLRTVPYRDVVGVLTVCYGETEGVQNRTYSAEECSELLNDRLMQDYYLPLVQCGGQAFVDAPVRVQAMFTSLAYNVGTGICDSTTFEYLLAGDYVTACNRLALYNKAGGRVWQGLVNRREDERRKCLGEKPL